MMWGNSSASALAARFARLVEQLGGDTAAAKAMGQQRDLLAAVATALAAGPIDLLVCDYKGGQVRGYVLVGKRAWGLALSRNGSRLYVANGLSDDLTIVDTAAMKALKTVKAGRSPHSVVVDD